MASLKDLTGRKFGRLTVVGRGENVGAHSRWNCRCECGVEPLVWSTSLLSGNTRSCGCFKIERTKKANTIHGKAGRGSVSREHRTWTGAIDRCTNPNSTKWKDYGGRGIKMCKRWLNSFENFYADMGQKPPGLTLDRIDVNGDYKPSNCRWATPMQQRHNQRVPCKNPNCTMC